MSKQHFSKKTKMPWPTKEVMEQVYEMKLWGGSGEEAFYSGDGSHKSEIVEPYEQVVILFLKSFTTPITVCDLGCGDFNVGKHLVEYTKEYKAVDIVPSLIHRNQEKFTSKNLSFGCLNIATEILPKADCAILRQVLQHLSNAEIAQVVNKLYSFKYVILTEHLPTADFIPNKDIISGQGIRIKKKSGVDLLEPPFDFKIKSAKELVTIHLGNNKGKIVTTLYHIF